MTGDRTMERLSEAIRQANRGSGRAPEVTHIYIEGRLWERQPDGFFEPDFYQTEFFKMLEQHVTNRPR